MKKVMEHFVLTYTGKPIGESGENCGTEYGFEKACDVCGSGAVIKGKLRCNKLGGGLKDIFQTIDGDIIISENLYIRMVNENIEVGGLKNVINIKGENLPFYHLFSAISLPKTFEANGLVVDNQCLTCKRNGYFNDLLMGDLKNKLPSKIIPVQLVYREEVLDIYRHFDILSTWEFMGLSNKKAIGNLAVRFARPLLIVSETMKRFMEKSQLQNLKFEPIKVIQ